MKRTKWKAGDHVFVRKAMYRNRPGVISRFELGEYEVTFTDGRQPSWALVESPSIEARSRDDQENAEASDAGLSSLKARPFTVGL
jgi:hypothetical protein